MVEAEAEAEAASERTVLDRLLAVFAEVRPGEGLSAAILTANVFLLLTAYYIVKPVREELILASPSGAEFKAYAGGASALLLLVLVPLYAKLVNRLPRNRLIIAVTLFFAACLLGFHALGHSEAARPSLGIPFFLWVGVFNMMVVAQFWGFANDLYTEEQGKRLFAIVGLGASGGAVAGAKLAAILLDPPQGFPLAKLDVFALLSLSAVLLAITAVLTQWAHARAVPLQAHAPAPARAAAQPSGAFALVFAHRYLRLLALFSLLFTFVNTNGEYILGKLVSAAHAALPEADKPGFIGHFYGEFFFYVNLLGLLMQAFAVSRIVKYGGLRVAFFVFPLLVLGSSLLVAIAPALAVLRITKTLENATDYSLNNTARQMLWLPTTSEMKYKAKQAVDTFMVRIGDVSSSLLVLFGAVALPQLGAGALSVRGFALVNFGLCLVWLVLARTIVREHERLGTATKAASGAATGA